ncbi:MAG: tetratricopeptide repeat protein [Burkholderiales bacterium]|nr:tetratricopeptide repeat protein [Burkholderiales bacterium]
MRLLAALLLLTLAWGGHAAPIDDAKELVRAGEFERALRVLDAHTASNPGDVQARFFKGVLLSERGQADAAIEVFRALTRDYPELPEPYNNLAVLYAARGDYHAARDALDMAVRLKPDYATAYENLGDIHVLLAGEAYAKAVQIDADNRSARAKLALTRELTSRAADTASTPR